MKKVCRGGFTLVEVMVSAAIFVVALTGVFLAYGQAVRMLDGLRQTSRAEDILLANVEYLRTRTWAQITNVVTTTTSSTPSGWSSNMTESISAISTNDMVCSHLELLTSDPLRIGLRNCKREIRSDTYPTANDVTQPMRQMTIMLYWDTLMGRQITNSMTVYVTKGGMTADVY